MFNFFDYEVFEALELYEWERRTILNCMNNILSELRAPDDEFTGHMLRLGIGQLLSYCRRFYDRQFGENNQKNNSSNKDNGRIRGTQATATSSAEYSKQF